MAIDRYRCTSSPHARLLERCELKFGGMLGPDETDVQNVMLLNRLIHYGRDATTIEADGRHVQNLVNELKLEGAKIVQTPGVSSSLKDEDVPLEEATPAAPQNPRT